MNEVYLPASIANLVAHTAFTPFQYRMLIPTLVE